MCIRDSLNGQLQRSRLGRDILLAHDGLAGRRLGEIGEQRQVLNKDLGCDGHGVFGRGGRVRPDLKRELVEVRHVADTGVFHRVVDLVNGRVQGIDGDDADGRLGGLIPVCRNVTCLLYTSRCV